MLSLIMSGVAVALQTVALVIWITLHRKIEKWVWITVLLGFVGMAAHRINEYLRFIPLFDSVTAVGIAGVALYAVVHARRWARLKASHTAALLAVQSKLENLRHDIEVREHIAPKIAEIIVDLRAQVSYYKDLAEKRDP